MNVEILKGENCKWCGRDLTRSFLTRMIGGVEKADAILYPVLLHLLQQVDRVFEGSEVTKVKAA